MAGRHFKQEGSSRSSYTGSGYTARAGYPSNRAAQPVGRATVNRAAVNRASVSSGYGMPTSGVQMRGSDPYGAPRKKSHKVAITVTVIVVLLLACVGVAGGMLLKSAKTVKGEAEGLMALAGGMKDKAVAGDYSGFLADATQVDSTVQSIKQETDGFLWKAAQFVPVVGGDVSAARKLVGVAADLSQSALLPVAQSLVSDGVSGKIVQDGGVINVPFLQSVATSVQNAYIQLEDANGTVQSIGATHISQVTELVDKAKSAFNAIMPLAKVANDYLPVIPQLFGADGQTRSYLIIAQNNSELRTTGGLPGSWGSMTITNGKMSVGDFSSVLHLDGLSSGATDEEKNTFGGTIATDPAQVNMTPDFPRIGQMSREYWRQLGNGEVNGVIAIDPVFLQRLLGLTGGFTANDGRSVDGSNAAQILLSDTYWKYGNNNDAQDAVFASVASDAFDAVMNGMGNMDFSALFDVIEQSAKDGRLLVWFANEQEEQIATQLGVSGAVPTDPTKPVLGVYANDDTYSKISWYTSIKTTIGQGVKNMDGTTTYPVTTTVGNTIDRRSASRAPIYIIGGNPAKRGSSDMLAWMFMMAPAGGSITDFTVSDGGLVSGSSIDNLSAYGLQTVRTRIHAMAGETVTFTYNVTVSAQATEPLALRTTPLAQESLM